MTIYFYVFYEEKEGQIFVLVSYEEEE